MLQVLRHDDVTQLRAWTRVSRLIDYEVSAYVVRGVLIDTLFPRVRDDLAAWLRAHRLEGVLLTHAHEDHAGNVELLRARGCPVGLADATLARIRVPGPIGMYRRICWGTAPPLTATPTPFAHAALQLRPAPGHTSDHHVVWDEARETLFTGDAFIGVKLRIAHPREDLRAQVRTLRDLVALRPARVFDAHRGPLRDPVALLRAKAEWLEETIGAIEAGADRGWSADQIRNHVLGREDMTGIASAGDYSKRNFVESVLATRAGAAPAST